MSKIERERIKRGRERNIYHIIYNHFTLIIEKKERERWRERERERERREIYTKKERKSEREKYQLPPLLISVLRING